MSEGPKPKKIREQKFGEYKGPQGVAYRALARPSDIGRDAQIADNLAEMRKPLLVPLHFPPQQTLSGKTALMAAQARAALAYRMFQINPQGFRQVSLKKNRKRVIGFVEKRFNEAAALA